jgi:hypothetical protein
METGSEELTRPSGRQRSGYESYVVNEPSGRENLANQFIVSFMQKPYFILTDERPSDWCLCDALPKQSITVVYHPNRKDAKARAAYPTHHRDGR